MRNLLLAATAAMAFAAPAAANIVTNGSFEAGGVATGWTGLNGSGPLITGAGPLTPAEGSQYLFLFPDNYTRLYQSLPTTPGATYNISFAAATFTGSEIVSLLFDDTIIGSVTATAGTFTYGSFSAPANPVESTTELQFRFSNDSNFLFLDDVNVTQASVAAVPEPASWAMLIAGFGLTGAAMRRRRTGVAAA